ncbi:hypothetical protein [Rodentibacter pneumotropicus]|uniref:hypothetical protein n=1 Tax=Rodentibacter pneumotropicus TaxID=758 RepID=UPI00037E8E9B|nr:hypothetical protein [Rodentibacter pneumotropicus]OOF62750.1 hypothetical protein BKL50_05150 [Rodentibacter pneumotropicus]OOF68034.1 hypothetical protein BKG95_04810 [Rodentibacter pneumotropicus]
MKMKKIILSIIILTLTACVQTQGALSSRSPISVNGHIKRLNTIACQDTDDWYLDGYRVGKDFSTYRENQLNQRIQFCGEATSTQRKAWGDGYLVGYKKVAKQNKKSKRSKKS